MIQRKVTAKGGLNPSELVLMNIMWDAQRPITGPEIMQLVNAAPEGPAFAKTSFHALINTLLDREFVISIGGAGHGKNQARQFVPAISRNEYYALQISSGRRYTPSDIPDLVSALISCSQTTQNDRRDIIKAISVLLSETGDGE